MITRLRLLTESAMRRQLTEAQEQARLAADMVEKLAPELDKWDKAKTAWDSQVECLQKQMQQYESKEG
jgi:hypothetical protein